jgi:hypothetical protein
MPIYNPNTAPSVILTVASKTTTYTATTSDDVILADTSGGAWTLTLYAASGNSGKVLTIKKTTSDFSALTIDANDSETIDGQATTTVNTQFEALKIICDGTNWHILERKFDQTPQSFTMSITGQTSDPTKGTTTTDQAFWTREGKYIYITFNYVQTGSGADGTGYYIYNIPSGLTIDTNYATTNNNANQVGFGSAYNGSTFVKGPMEIISSTGLVMTGFSDTTAPNQIGSAFYQLSGASIIYGFFAKVPISGWKGN